MLDVCICSGGRLSSNEKGVGYADPQTVGVQLQMGGEVQGLRLDAATGQMPHKSCLHAFLCNWQAPASMSAKVKVVQGLLGKTSCKGRIDGTCFADLVLW